MNYCLCLVSTAPELSKETVGKLEPIAKILKVESDHSSLHESVVVTFVFLIAFSGQILQFCYQECCDKVTKPC